MDTSDGSTDEDAVALLDEERDDLALALHLLKRQRSLLGDAMELNDQISTALDKARTSLADAKSRVISLETAAKSGLTAEQGQVILAAAEGLAADADSIAPATPAPATPGTTGTTDGGETNVPVGGTPPG